MPESTTSLPYTADEKARLERDLQLLYDETLALFNVLDEDNLGDVQRDAVRRVLAEVKAAQRLLKERASADAVAEQIAVARLFIAEAVGH